MNRDHSYYPYNNNEQPLEVEWQAPEQNDIAGNTQWNGRYLSRLLSKP